MKRKRSRDFPERVVPLGDRSSSPSGVVTELVPRACTCRKPARSDGVEVNGGRSVPSAQSRDRGLIVPAPGSPFLAVDDNRAQEKRRRLKSTRRREPKRRAHTQTRREVEVQPRTGEEEKKKRDPNRVCTPLFSHAGPRPFSPPIFPPLVPPPPPSSLTQKPLEGELSQLPLPRGKGQRAGNPRVPFVVSPPRAIRLRSRTLSNAERPVAWPVEDGVWSVASGGDGGGAWWSFGGGVLVVEWCLIQNNHSERKTTT